jgi:hypothetical protein
VRRAAPHRSTALPRVAPRLAACSSEASSGTHLRGAVLCAPWGPPRHAQGWTALVAVYRRSGLRSVTVAAPSCPGARVNGTHLGAFRCHRGLTVAELGWGGCRDNAENAPPMQNLNRAADGATTTGEAKLTQSKSKRRPEGARLSKQAVTEIKDVFASCRKEGVKEVRVNTRARWVTLRARWVTLRARWVTLRARWVTLRARWVTLRARWVTLRARWVTLRARWVTLRARWVTLDR